jgi:hypothetical protein
MGLPAYSRGRSHPAPSLRLLVILIVPAQSGGPAAVAVRVAQPAFGLFLVDPGVGPCRGTCAVQRHQEERAPGHGSGKSIEWDGDPVAVIIDQYGGWAVDARDCEVSFWHRVCPAAPVVCHCDIGCRKLAAAVGFGNSLRGVGLSSNGGAGVEWVQQGVRSTDGRCATDA